MTAAHLKSISLLINACVAACLSCQAVVAVPTPPTVLPDSIDVESVGDAHLLKIVETNGDLKIKIYEHKVQVTSSKPEAWSFVTDGLSAYGQKEIVLTVLKRTDEKADSYPEQPIKLFALISGLAKNNKLVSEGGYTELKNAGFLAAQFKGLIYTPVSKRLGVPLPDDCIAALPVTAEEMTVYQLAGPSRVMVRLGKEAHFFPFPTWCDRDRKSAFDQADIAEMKEDPVFRSAKAQTYNLTAVQEKDTLILHLNGKTASMLLSLLEELPADSAMRLALGINRQTDALLVWETKSNNNRSIIAPEDSPCNKIGTTFIALLPGLKQNEILAGSDGCALMLTREEFSRFKEALKSKVQFALPVEANSDLKNFSIVWDND